jgi:hypothetical protein
MLEKAEMSDLLSEAGNGGRSSTAGGETVCAEPRDSTSNAPLPYTIRSKSEGRPWSRGLPNPNIRLPAIGLVSMNFLARGINLDKWKISYRIRPFVSCVNIVVQLVN